MVHRRPLRLVLACACAALAVPASGAFSSPRGRSRPAGGPTSARSPSRLRDAVVPIPQAGRSSDPSGPELALEERTWAFRGVHPVHYEVAYCPSPGGGGGEDGKSEEEGEVVPLVLLSGFGVASFHYRRLMRELLLRNRRTDSTGGGPSSEGRRREYRIYALDYLGQGRSWPPDCDDGRSPAESGLGYSADTWVEQVACFVSDVVLDECQGTGRVHLVGNSVGGYLSTILASRRPDLVETLTLVNATPVWGLDLPGWDGRLPAPSLPRAVGRAGFDLIRNPDVIGKYLDSAYVCPGAHDGSHPDSFHPPGHPEHDPDDAGRCLGERIRECTEGKGGHAAFASILFSPPATDHTYAQGGGGERRQKKSLGLGYRRQVSERKRIRR